MPFPYKSVLVLGATSGIGRALAERIVKDGSSVMVTGRREENLVEFQQEHRSLQDEKGVAVKAVKLDMTDSSSFPGFVERTTKEFPDLDCIIFNSGIQRGLNFADPESIDLDMVQTEWSTNYFSYVALTKAFLPFFQKKSTESAFVYVSSVLGLLPSLKCPNYCATKAALHQLVIAMREQLRTSSNIKVMEIGPPAVQTELHDEKNQPDYQGDRDVGMPLKDFADAAYQGMVDKKDANFVGMGEQWYDRIEPARLEGFKELNQLK